MLSKELVMSWMVGTGIAVKARQRWRSLPFGENLRFADDRSIPELRAEHPEWRAQSLAPVSIIDDVSLLPSLSDDSLDYIVAYHLLMDEDRIYQALDTAARLLRPGGTLVIPVPDDRYVPDAGPEVTAIPRGLQRLDRQLQDDQRLEYPRWMCDRLAVVVGRLAILKRAVFDLELVARNGFDNLAVFRRKNDKCLETGSLIEHDAVVYVVDGPVIRQIPNLQTLDKIRKGKPIHFLNKRQFSLFVVGQPFLGD
jgi:methyltransferase family protein